MSNKKRKFIGIVICIYSELRIGELLALALLYPNKEKAKQQTISALNDFNFITTTPQILVYKVIITKAR